MNAYLPAIAPDPREGSVLMTLHAAAWPRADLATAGTAKAFAALSGRRSAVPTLERLRTYVGDVLDAVARCDS